MDIQRSMSTPYKVTDDFEAALCAYTGARYAVAVNSCSMALQLAIEWTAQHQTRGITGRSFYVNLPRHTYVSVPCAVRHAGGGVKWRDEQWQGIYQLKPLPVWDCARRFTSGMYVPSQYQCVSFATNKILGIEQGGAILHDDAKSDEWFRMARFDGRRPGLDPKEQQEWTVVGHHCILLPSIAAQLILKLHHLPRHNEDMPPHDYPDLSRFNLWD